jgi:hypothetical protein
MSGWTASRTWRGNAACSPRRWCASPSISATTGFSDLQKVFRDSLSRQIAPGRTYPQPHPRHHRVRGRHAAQRRDRPGVPVRRRRGAAGTSTGPGRQGLRTRSRSAGRHRCHLGGRRAPGVSGGGLSRLCAAAHRQAGSAGVGAGRHARGQVRSIRRRDVLVAVSFAPYAEETLAVTATALARGARLVALTDSRMSPLARQASAVLLVQEHVTFGFRTLTSPMALAQSLFIALARLRRPVDPRRRDRLVDRHARRPDRARRAAKQAIFCEKPVDLDARRALRVRRSRARAGVPA